MGQNQREMEQRLLEQENARERQIRTLSNGQSLVTSW